MAERTGIEWCDSTWNPLVGCSPCSEACENCYARRMAVRLARNPTVDQAAYGRCVRLSPARGWEWSGQIAFFPERLDQPKRWRKPRRIFVGSMTDLFHDNVSGSALADIGRVMHECPQHTFMLLTKRASHIPDTGLWRTLPNVWLGVTAENQARAEERIPTLLRIPAAMRFVSLEPLLGPVDMSPYLVSWCRVCGKGLDVCGCGTDEYVEADQTGLMQKLWDEAERRLYAPNGPRERRTDKQRNREHEEVIDRIYDSGTSHRINWVIAGCETGPHRRHTDIAWIRAVVEQCHTAGVPCFVKAIEVPRRGGMVPGEYERGPVGSAVWEAAIADHGSRVSKDMAEWPADLRVREFPLTREV